MTSIEASFRFDAVMTTSMPIKELPTTTSFFPSLAAGESVSVGGKTREDAWDITCINLSGIVKTSESENVLEVGPRDQEFPGVTSRSKDEFVVVDKLFAAFQHDLLSRNIDGSDGLTNYVFRLDAMRGVRDPRTVEVRKVAPNLILRSAAVLHSTLETSATNDLLSFGL